MAKEWKKLMPIGKATTRIVFINADLIRSIVPNASKDTELQGKWSVEGNKLVLEIRVTE